MKIYIYGLYDNNENVIKYIGKTYNIKKRLNEHINESKRNLNKKNISEKQKWIIECLNNNLSINIKILQECNEDNWSYYEKYWISYYNINNNLTNLTLGGEQGGCVKNITLTYNDAKNIIKQFNIKSKNDFYKKFKILNLKNFSKNPYEYYLKYGWISWCDFLGTEKIQDNLISNNYISYNEAKEYIKENITAKTIVEWKQLVKENKIPYFIPNRPERFYIKKERGWISWGDFLGTNRIANQNKKFISYNEAKIIINKLSINSRNNFYKKNINYYDKYNIPENPEIYYKKTKEWISWGDFLNTGKIQDNILALNYISYNEAKEYIKDNICVNNVKEWKVLVKNNKIPYFIPNHPEIFYKNKNRGWISWYDYLSK